MFKPTLKRSKLEQIELFANKKDSPHEHHQLLLKGVSALNKYNELPSSIIPTSLFFTPSPQVNSERLFNPLNFEWSSYPPHIQRKIQSRQQTSSRGIGYHQEYIWYFEGNQIILSHVENQKYKRLQLTHQIDCLAFGDLESCSLHFKSRKMFILAVGVENCLHLYGIDKESLTLTEFKFSYEIMNSRLIQKIKFVNKNEIVVGTDTCNYCHFDFTDQTKIRCQQLPILKKMLPFLPLLFPKVQYFVEDLLVSGNFIYSLVREQREVGWLNLSTKKLMNKFTRQNKEPQIIVQNRRVQIYQIDKITNQIKEIHKLKEEDFIRKLKIVYPELESNFQKDSLKIVSIYLDSNNDKEEKLLSIVTKGGYFVTLAKGQYLKFAKKPFCIPQSHSVGVVGFCLTKKDQAEVKTRPNTLTASLGMNNLTIMNDSIWFINNHSIQVVKCQTLPGEIIQTKGSILLGKKWIIFTKQGYYTVKRLDGRQILFSYLFVSKDVGKKQPEQSWNDQIHLQYFIQNLGKSVGYQKICEMLIQILIFDNFQFKVNTNILSMIREELRGTSNVDFRDWSYEVNQTSASKKLQMTLQLYAEVWKFLIDLQFKKPKQQAAELARKGINCSSYWYAVVSIFNRIISNLLVIKPSQLKQNLQKTDEMIRLLDKLSLFFMQKKERQDRVARQSLFRKREGAERSSYNTIMAKYKKNNIKKEDQSNQTTLDVTAVTSNKIINESNMKLQSLIELSIKKIKSIITVFIYLADFSQNQNLPNLEDCLKNRKHQQTIKKYLLARVQNKDKLKQFADILPQLQLEKDLKLLKWYQYQIVAKKAESSNLSELATCISWQYIPQTLKLLEGRLDLQVDLLLNYLDYLTSQLDAMNKMTTLQQKSVDLFSDDKKIVTEQKREFVLSQMKLIDPKVKQCITAAIKSYITSSQQNYNKSESVIDSILQIVAIHDDSLLNDYMERQLTHFGIVEKLIFFKNKKIKKEKLMNPIEILTRKQVVESKKMIARSLMSNYELLLLQKSQQ